VNLKHKRRKIKVSIALKLVGIVALVELAIMFVFTRVEWLEHFPFIESILDTLILSIVIVVVFYYLLQKPLKSILLSMSAVEKGHFDVKLPIKSRDEIGTLATSFNKMVEQLREITFLKELTLASIGDAVIATDGKGIVTFINAIAEQITGWKAAEVIDQKSVQEIFQISNEQTGQPVENPVEKVLREDVIVGLANHTVLKTKDGRKIPIDDSGAPIKAPDGSLLGVVLVFRDVTEKRRAEEKNKKMVVEKEETCKALEEKNKRLEDFQNLTVGRELDMVKLKEEINELLEKLGQPKRYEETKEIREKENEMKKL